MPDKNNCKAKENTAKKGESTAGKKSIFERCSREVKSPKFEGFNEPKPQKNSSGEESK